MFRVFVRRTVWHILTELAMVRPPSARDDPAHLTADLFNAVNPVWGVPQTLWDRTRMSSLLEMSSLDGIKSPTRVRTFETIKTYNKFYMVEVLLSGEIFDVHSWYLFSRK